MHYEKETAPGVTGTESGQSKESESSVSELGEKVKSAKFEDPFPFGAPPVRKPAPPLDLRTEMFMLNSVKEILGMCYGISKEDKYGVLCDLISKCAEANADAE